MVSAGFRTNEALCLLSHHTLYLGPEGGRHVGLHRQSGIHAQETRRFQTEKD